jgi:hypothetical protein
MAALSPDLDLSLVLQESIASGAAFVPQALNETARERLLVEVEHGPFTTLPEQVGSKGVRQQVDGFVVGGGMDDYPVVRGLRDDLVVGVRDQGHLAAGLANWLPNHVSVQRYHPGAVGVSCHLDGRRYRYLVAVFTLDGAAAFDLCADRSGRVLRRWDTAPGSLLLMRAPGLAGDEDGRPLHAVRGPKGRSRTSLTFRMDSSAL